ncbi:unnamed protein product [Cyclocybe aegerita]|uniref:Uncharacterized protein n=1 Tax=Cyclocybe aegerita TaxID=1973307 RepID=A0A8S0XCT9_CYCAE|nr:unnamed protein product [Cyclocybe aegerita]
MNLAAVQMPDHDIDDCSDFRLPGLVAHAANNSRLITAMAFSYSGIQNPRLLECHFHAPWGQCFDYLIQDLGPETFVIAQQKLAPFDRLSIQKWLKQKVAKKEEAKELERQRKANMLGKPIDVAAPPPFSTPGPPDVIMLADQVNVGGTDAADLEGEDDEEAELLAETSFETLPDARTEEKAPDFSIFKAFKFLNRETGDIITSADFPQNPADWDIVRVAAARVLLLAELKPPPSRHSEDEGAFQFALDNNIRKAMLQAFEQAERAFAADDKVGALVAIAVSGEWWAWKLVKREDAIPSPVSLEMEPAVPPAPQQQEETRRSLRLEKLAARQAEATAQDSQEQAKDGRGQGSIVLRLRSKPKQWYKEPDSDPDGENDNDKVSVRRATSKKGKEPDDRVRTVLQNAKLGYSDQAKATVLDALPTSGKWSDIMRLSTPASNQAFYILHYFIEHGRLPTREQAQPDNPGPSGNSGESRKRTAESTSVEDEQTLKKQRMDTNGEGEDVTSDGCMTPANDD